MDFGEILSRAWQIIWKHKILWLFGFLAALGSPGGSNPGGSGSGSSGSQGFTLPGMQDMPNFQDVIEEMPAWLPLLIILGLVLAVLFIVLSTYGRIGLTRGAWMADEGQDQLSFGALWGYGSRYFWRAIALVLILVAIALLIFIPGTLLTIITGGVALICFLPLMCVLVIGLVLLSMLFDLAIVAIVNEDLSVMDGINRAWGVVRANIAQIIGMAIILWIISAVISFILFLPLLLIVAPVLIGFATQERLVMGGAALVSLILFLLYLPVLIVVRGMLQSYIGSAWTLVFRRLSGRPALSAS